MKTDDRRTYVRGRMAFKVNFCVVDPEDYDRLNVPDPEKITDLETPLPSGWGEPHTVNNDPVNRSLINFLLKLDEKLDLIIHSLAKVQQIESPFRMAVGEDISGTGMKIITDMRLDPDQVVHATFLLFRNFFLYVDVYGRVTRVEKTERDGPEMYEAGIEFLNLKPDDREKIITIVFKANREAIRKVRRSA